MDESPQNRGSDHTHVPSLAAAGTNHSSEDVLHTIVTDSAGATTGTPVRRMDDSSRIEFLGDRYLILGEIARGGMGVIYKVKQRHTGRICAVKMLRQIAIDNDLAVKRFNREAKAVIRLSHPNLIGAYDYGIFPAGEPYLIMEYVEGESLSALLKARGRLTLREALPIFKQICRGMICAHNEGVIHRDLKPSNVMLVKQLVNEPLVRVIDFGLARFENSEFTVTSDLTRTGDIFGSPLYMSPEQAHGHVVDQRSDIYSLGVLMFETLAGAPPFSGMSALETILMHLNEPMPRLLDKKGKPILPAMEQLIGKAMMKEPADRFESMHELLEELERIERIIDSPLASALSSQASLSLPKARSKKNQLAGLPILAATALAAAAVIVGSIIWSPNPTKQLDADKPDKPVDSLGRDLMNAENVTDDATLNKSRITLDHEEPKVYLAGHGVDDEQMKEFLRRNNVTSLMLQQNPIHSESLQYIVHLPIKTLKLNDTKIDDQAIGYLTKLKSLKILALNNTAITDKGLKNLKGLPNLKELHLGDTKVTDAGLEAIIEQLPDLEILTLENDAGLSNRSLLKLSSLAKLRSLFLDGTNVSDGTMIKLVSSLRLETISLNRTAITDKTVRAIAESNIVKRLRISQTSVTDKGVTTLSNCPTLKELSLTNCPQVSQQCKAGLRRVLRI